MFPRPALLFLALASLAAAQTTSPPACTTPSPASTTPLWTLSQWSTNFTVPEESTVTFRLENTLTGYTALCLLQGEYPQGYCVSAAWENGVDDGVRDTATLFEYRADGKKGELSIYQEWGCAVGSDNKTVKADGKVLVMGSCAGEEGTKKGEICGTQGGEGGIFAEHVEIE